jgi:penicillin amidase
MRLALKQAMAMLRPLYGDDWRRWRWDTAHRLVMAHRPFEQVPLLARLFSIRVPSGGSGTTVNVASHEGGSDGAPFDGAHAPSYRAIYDLGDLERSLFIIPGGQSGHPLSPHYRDLTDLWLRGDYLPMRLDDMGDATAQAARLRLMP